MPSDRPARVAMIDDNPDDVLLARLFLRREKLALEVTRYATGEAFLDAMNGGASPPDLALVDLNLPLMRGADLLRRARGALWARDVIFGVVSGSTDPADRAESLAAGAAFFLSKPITLASIETICAAAPRFALVEIEGARALTMRTAG